MKEPSAMRYPPVNRSVRLLRPLVAVVACLALLSSPSFAAPQKDKDKELKPLDIVTQCVEAFFKGDDAVIRAFLPDKARNTLSELAAGDYGAYTEIRRALLAGNPVVKFAGSGIRAESVTTGSGGREMLLKSGGQIVGNIAFRELTEETLSVIEIRVFQNSSSPTPPSLFQAVLTRERDRKQFKTWRITAFYAASSGGPSDEILDMDHLLDARIAANESAIPPIIRSIQEAQARYVIGPGQNKFGTLEELRRAGELSAEAAGGKAKGYQIEVTVNNEAAPPTFAIHATPQTYNRTGRRSFVMDDTAVLHAADRRGERATLSDPILRLKDADDAEEDNE
jgi:hypothetical protein